MTDRPAMVSEEQVEAGFRVLWNTPFSSLGDSPTAYKELAERIFLAMRHAEPIPDVSEIEAVARAIAYEFDIDADVFIGMHGREKWEKQWHPIAKAAIAAMQSAGATHAADHGGDGHDRGGNRSTDEKPGRSQ